MAVTSVRQAGNRDRESGRRRLADEGSGDVADRTRAFLASRSDAEGRPLFGIYAAAAAQRRKMRAGGTPGGPGSVNWTPLGPSVIAAGSGRDSGRTTSVVAGPGGNRVYAGAANGGVWVSTDGGNNWSTLNDYVVSATLFGGAPDADALSVGALCVRFGATVFADEVFVGTGEANGNYDAYFGDGIRHLVAGSWSLEATNLQGRGIYAVVIDPNDATPTNVYAATTAGLYKRPTSGSMATWTQVTSPAFTSSGSPVCSFIASGSWASRTFYAAFYGAGIYSSTDGTTWTALTGITSSGRISLAASESSPGVIYALVSDGSIYRLSAGTFYPVTGLPASVLFADPGGGQGWYDIAIAVHPTDPDTIIVGGDAYAVFKGTISGGPGSFVFPFNAANTSNPRLDPTWVGANVHSDVHAIAYGLNASGTAGDPSDVWVGSAGGLFHSASGGAAGSFQPQNLGLAITQFAYLAQRSDTDAVLFAGAQDNGTPRLLGEEAGQDMAGGDGGGVAFDPGAEPGRAYRAMRQYVYASLDATTDGGMTWPGINFPPVTAGTTAQRNAANQENSSTGFVAPLRAAASGSTTLAAFGTNRLWLTPDWGTSWTTLPTGTNPYASATPDLAQDVIDGGNVTAIAFASVSQVYAATAATIWRYDFTGSSWSRTVLPTAGLPAFRYITALAPDLDPSAAPDSLYVALGSGGVAHLYYFNGSTWSIAMPTSVVDVPTHAVAVDPVAPTDVYVGTDVGCFKGVKTAPATWTWSLYSQGLPESAITDLAVFAAAPPARLLRAATHGRSAWEIDLAATAGLDPDIYLRVNYADTGRMTAAGTRFPWVEGSLDPTHAGYRLYHWMSADIKVRRSSLTGLPPLGSPVNYLDFAVNIGDYVDTTTHVETGDLSGTDNIYVELHNRGLTPVPAAQVHVLLLSADASAGLPSLPSGWTAHVNAADPDPGWLAGTPWQFVDPVSPYRLAPRDLDVRTPQVVSYQLDFGALGLPPGHDHVCLAAFVTTPGDAIASTLTDLNQVTMTDKHVAHRNIHLVALGATPGTEGDPSQRLPQTFFIDFHNPTEKVVEADLIFDRESFPGPLSLVLPRLPQLHQPDGILDGFRVQKRGAQGAATEAALGEWLERTGEWLEAQGEAIEHDPPDIDPRRYRHRRDKFSSLDHSRVYVADQAAARPALRGVRLPAAGQITAAVTVTAPPGAKPGDRYRMNIIQQRGTALVGGSTYIIAVTRRHRR